MQTIIEFQSMQIANYTSPKIVQTIHYYKQIEHLCQSAQDGARSFVVQLGVSSLNVVTGVFLSL